MSSTPERDTVVRPTNSDQSIVDSQLPGEMQAQLAHLFPDNEPTTFREWIDAWSEQLDLEGGALSPDDLRAENAGPADAELRVDASSGSVLDDGTTEFHGMLVPVVASLVTDDSIGIESECPRDQTDVRLDITPEGAASTPEDAVVSFGVASDLSERDFDEESDLPYDQLCSYAIPFSSADAYKSWASETTDAVTVALPVEEAFDVALETYRAAERRALSSSAFHCNCC